MDSIEHDYLREFVTWHIRACGVQKMHIVSTDEAAAPDSLLDFVRTGQVVWHEQPLVPPALERHGRRFDDSKALQTFVAKHLADKARRVLYIDCDEYLLLPPGQNDVSAWLDVTYPDMDVVYFPWYVFPLSEALGAPQLAAVARNPVAAHFVLNKFVFRPNVTSPADAHTPVDKPGLRSSDVRPRMRPSISTVPRAAWRTCY